MAEGRKGLWKRLYWENILFLVLTHALGAAAVAYAALVLFSWKTVALSAVWLVFTALAVSGGYHRLYSHRAYKCATVVRLFHLAFGAAAWQSSALNWASDHRDHHAYTDQEKDPYNITKGFWWAHWGWLCWRGEPRNFSHAKDLVEDRLVAFQDRHYLVLALGFGVLLPTAIAASWGDAMGGLLMAGFLRLLIHYHASFAVNSVSHTLGSRPYSTANSARETTVVALLTGVLFVILLPTMGEGFYHNYHHRFPADYRNGIRWWHLDPAKWFIGLLGWVGLATELNVTPEDAITKAKELVLVKARAVEEAA